ncbi:unnamed protein product [Wuchereria bancrofti]|uniref:Uncharacterized protein n=2 Tax=Wuchereria bancrofti TaxID=6293 RepID=A0A3P7EBY5_WUCBA|nr:unnamed protein product [Wuchereria bancrofti]
MIVFSNLIHFLINKRIKLYTRILIISDINFRHIPQLCTAFTECEIFKIEKPNLTKLLTLCKDEIYRNNDRCFRVFLLVMKFLNDTNAMKIFNAFYDNKMFIQLSDFYISWIKRCGDNHNVIRSILIKAEKMDAKPKWTLSIWKRSFTS